MPNLDLTITDIMFGDIAVLKIMKGDKQKWPKLPTYTVSGVVTFDSNALSGVVVTLGSYSMTTGSDGVYSFTIEVGTYTLSATKSGYTFTPITVNVSGNTTQNIVMSGQTYMVSGVVTDGTNPLSGVVVTLGGNSFTTSSEGVYSFSVAAGTYTLSATTKGYTYDSETLSVSDNTTHSIAMTLTASQYLTFKALESGTFQCSKAANYSINGGAWTALTAATDTPTLAVGDTIRWKATNTPDSTSGVGKFSSTGQYNAYGNPLSMRSGDNFVGVTSLPNNNYMFLTMFKQNTNLVNAENISLDFTTIRNYCYQEMFYGCTSLISIPDLPATTLLTRCYQNMFAGCTSLTKPMMELPATTLINGCYSNMFDGCTSLTETPMIKATTGGSSSCSYMFRNCTSLTKAHDLLITNLTSTSTYLCHYMFSGCTSLEYAPELPAVTLVSSCYSYMFQGCTKLKYIKCLATNYSTAYTGRWLDNVASSGTFVKHPNMTTWGSGYNGIPTGWTVEDAVLE